MKLTKSQLKQIIKEELLQLEMFDTGSAGGPGGVLPSPEGPPSNRDEAREVEGVPESAIKEFLLKGGFYGDPADPDLDELEQEWGYIRGYLREPIKMIWDAKQNANIDYQETMDYDEYQDESGRD